MEWCEDVLFPDGIDTFMFNHTLKYLYIVSRRFDLDTQMCECALFCVDVNNTPRRFVVRARYPYKDAREIPVKARL